MRERIDVNELLRGVDLATVAAQRGVVLKRAGRELKGCCPFHAERTPSFYIFAKGAGQRFHCFGCGASGSAIGFVMRFDGVGFREAVERLGGRFEEEPSRAAERRAAIERQRREQAEREAAERAAKEMDGRALWDARRPAAGTVVEAYFAARGIVWPTLPPTIGFLPGLPYWWQADGWARARVIARLPAMVAAIQDPRGRVIAAHLTYLRPDGDGKADGHCPVTGEVLPAKKIRGNPAGGAIRLARAPEGDGELGVSEGIESGASVMQAGGWALPVWAAVSLGNLAGHGLGRGALHPTRRAPNDKPMRLPSRLPDMTRPGIRLPGAVRRVIILADNDSKDPVSAECLLERAARRFCGEGRAVRVAWPAPGSDFNDMLRGRAA